MEKRVFQIQPVLTAIQQCASGLKFREVVQQMMQIYQFRNAKEPSLQLMQLTQMDHLAVGIYRCVLYQLLMDVITEVREDTSCFSERKQLIVERARVGELSKKMGEEIKKSYQGILENNINNRTKGLQFALFLVFLSSETVLVSLGKSETALWSYLGEKIKAETNNISALACIIANYHLTGMKVSPTIYQCLKKRFLKATIRGKHLERLSSSLFKNKTQSQTPVSGRQQPFQPSELFENLNKIFAEKESPTLKYPPALRPKVRKITQMKDSFYSNVDKGKGDADNKRGIKRKKTELRGIANSRRENHLDTIFSSLLGSTMKFLEEDQKEKKQKTSWQIARQKIAQRHSLEIWQKRVGAMRESNNIEIAQLERRSEWQRYPRRQGKGWMDSPTAEQIQNTAYFTPKMQALSRVESHDKKALKFKQGFQDTNSYREGYKMGIVEKVLNCRYDSPEKTNRKIHSKGLKAEFEEFIGQSIEGDKICHSDKNDHFRLQMALMGTIK